MICLARRVRGTTSNGRVIERNIGDDNRIDLGDVGLRRFTKIVHTDEEIRLALQIATGYPIEKLEFVECSD